MHEREIQISSRYDAQKLQELKWKTFIARNLKFVSSRNSSHEVSAWKRTWHTYLHKIINYFDIHFPVRRSFNYAIENKTSIHKNEAEVESRLYRFDTCYEAWMRRLLAFYERCPIKPHKPIMLHTSHESEQSRSVTCPHCSHVVHVNGWQTNILCFLKFIYIVTLRTWRAPAAAFTCKGFLYMTTPQLPLGVHWQTTADRIKTHMESRELFTWEKTRAENLIDMRAVN